MRWRAEQRPTVIVFHAAAVLHYRHPVSQLADDAQVMSDKQQPHVQLLLQLAQQLQNLRLHRYVQGGSRLVGHQQLRARQQRHGDHHPLALAAGELMRIVRQPPRRLTDPDALQAVEYLPARRLFAHSPV